jgi:hypothetical protein
VAKTRWIVRGSSIVKVTAGAAGARRALGLRTYNPVNTTVSIVSPKAPIKANATARCAAVGFGRCCDAAGFGSVGDVVTGRSALAVRSVTIREDASDGAIIL